MKMVLAALALALAFPAAAGTLRGTPQQLQMYCQHCDPGPAEQPKDTPAGIVLCKDCSNQDDPVLPVIWCATCFATPGQPFACHGCDIQAAP